MRYDVFDVFRTLQVVEIFQRTETHKPFPGDLFMVTPHAEHGGYYILSACTYFEKW